MLDCRQINESSGKWPSLLAFPPGDWDILALIYFSRIAIKVRMSAEMLLPRIACPSWHKQPVAS